MVIAYKLTYTASPPPSCAPTYIVQILAPPCSLPLTVSAMLHYINIGSGLLGAKFARTRTFGGLAWSKMHVLVFCKNNCGANVLKNILICVNGRRCSKHTGRKQYSRAAHWTVLV